MRSFLVTLFSYSLKYIVLAFSVSHVNHAHSKDISDLSKKLIDKGGPLSNGLISIKSKLICFCFLMFCFAFWSFTMQLSITLHVILTSNKSQNRFSTLLKSLGCNDWEIQILSLVLQSTYFWHKLKKRKFSFSLWRVTPTLSLNDNNKFVLRFVSTAQLCHRESEPGDWEVWFMTIPAQRRESQISKLQESRKR